MAEEKRSKGLGRGLSALLGEQDREAHPAARPAGARELPIAQLRPNPFQPRRVFQDEDLDGLAASIREKGVLQPIIVRPVPGESGAFQIIAGERRWRAAQRAKRHTVPVIQKDLSDAEALEVALIENIQRTDLNAIEEAAGYQALMDKFGYKQDQLAKEIGKSRSHVANTLRLLSLPEPVRELVEAGTLSAGHARALLTADDAEGLARQVAAKGLSVRETEALARHSKTKDVTDAVRKLAKANGGGAPEKDADTLALERDVSNALGLKVDIRHKGEAGGELRVAYTSLEQLDDVCRRLCER